MIAIKLGLKIMEETTAFKAMKVTYQHDPPEVCKGITPRSDEYWRCHIMQRAWSWLHVTGTCSMGKYSDIMSVVDSKLRVKGIKQLRVCDASVMPQPTNANTAGI
jgi:choline dehydrogenase